MEGINKTDSYYRESPVDLMTEFTICESLGHADSPYMTAFREPRTFGASLGKLLVDLGLLRPRMRICEIGGGYGTLMRGLLESHGNYVDRVIMVDLSRRLLERQRRSLSAWPSMLSFINGNVQELVPALSGINLCILNEVVGDLDTWTNLNPSVLPAEVSRLVERYDLDLPREGLLHFNMGAVRVVEALSVKGWSVFLSEHSSDPLIPRDMDYLGRDLEPDGYPREIRLKGHSEFTIRFSHLAAVARSLGRETMTGPLIDLVGLEHSPRMRAVFCGRMTSTDEQAVLYELLDHIREYRWMVIA